MFDKVTVWDKDILQTIPVLIIETGSKTEVFNQLKDQVPEQQHALLAKRIAGYITNETKIQNRIPMILLVVSYILSIITIAADYTIKFNLYHKSAWIVLLIISLINVLLIYGYIRYKLYAYTTAVSLCFISLIVSLTGILVEANFFILLNYFHLILNLVFIHLLRRSLFPDITFWGNVRSDKSKNYIFTN